MKKTIIVFILSLMLLAGCNAIPTDSSEKPVTREIPNEAELQQIISQYTPFYFSLYTLVEPAAYPSPDGRNVFYVIETTESPDADFDSWEGDYHYVFLNDFGQLFDKYDSYGAERIPILWVENNVALIGGKWWCNIETHEREYFYLPYVKGKAIPVREGEYISDRKSIIFCAEYDLVSYVFEYSYTHYSWEGEWTILIEQECDVQREAPFDLEVVSDEEISFNSPLGERVVLNLEDGSIRETERISD